MSSATITLLPPIGRQAQPAELVWEEPPADGRARNGQYAPIASALRQQPCRWACIRTYTREQARRGWHFASQINAGKYADFRTGFEARSRTVDGHVRVYVRYLGTEDGA